MAMTNKTNVRAFAHFGTWCTHIILFFLSYIFYTFHFKVNTDYIVNNIFLSQFLKKQLED